MAGAREKRPRSPGPESTPGKKASKTILQLLQILWQEFELKKKETIMPGERILSENVLI